LVYLHFFWEDPSR